MHQQIATAGFIPLWPNTIPLQDTIELIDSLLAAPVSSVIVDLPEPDVRKELLDDLYQRGQDHLLIGVVRDGYVDIGFPVQFTFPAETEGDVAHINIPIVRTAEGAIKIARAGCLVAIAKTTDLDNFLEIVRSGSPSIVWIVWGVIHVKAVSMWQAAGMKGLIAPVWLHDDQLMPETITRIRRYNRCFI